MSPFRESPNGITRKDPVEELIDGLLGYQKTPLPVLIAAVWRTAFWHASDGPPAAHDARAALVALLSQA